jgi:hypothetical protein
LLWAHLACAMKPRHSLRVKNGPLRLCSKQACAEVRNLLAVMVRQLLQLVGLAGCLRLAERRSAVVKVCLCLSMKTYGGVKVCRQVLSFTPRPPYTHRNNFVAIGYFDFLDLWPL